MNKAADIKLPLTSLLAFLKSEGFEIGTSAVLDLQRVVANVNSQQVNDPAELQYLLAPIICRNKEEQEKFYKLFNSYLHNLRQEEVMVEAQTPSLSKQYLKKYGWWFGLFLILVIGGITLYRFIPRGDNPVTAGITIAGSNKINLPGDTLLLSVNYLDSASAKSYKTDWTISGPSFQQQITNAPVVTLRVDSAGIYQAIASTFGSNGALLKHDTTEVEVLCEVPPAVNITRLEQYSNSQTFKAELNTGRYDTAYHFHWFVNDVPVEGDSLLTTTALKSNRSNTVRVMVNWPYQPLHCSADSILATYEVQPPFELTVQSNNEAPPFAVEKTTNWANIWIASLGLFLLPLLVSAVVWWRLKKPGPVEKDTTEDHPQQEEFSGPYSIEFNKQDDSILPETGISQLAETLRKRHTSNVFQLSVKKTIGSTIRKGGFPVLEYIPRTRPSDFLILLDQQYPNGHLSHLFGFVIERLRREQVHLSVYTFSGEPLLLSNEALHQVLLPIDKVARLYPDTMLIIFSQADAFFRSYDVALKPWATDKFKSWNTKMIITPVPKSDWGVKEKVLYQAGFTVVPADTNAHTVIGDEINQMIDRQKLKKEIVPTTYSARQYNFNRWRQVSAYLHKAVGENNERFSQSVKVALVEQWLCALAVYPHIDWQVTIAIGKAFEEAYDQPGRLVNYNNLLVISRIQWMNDQQLMDSLRLEMLHHLDIEKEALARQVIVSLMNEIEPGIGPQSLVKNEWDLVHTTNKFLLHAHQPDTHSLSAAEMEQFRQYVNKDQVDWALQTYLEQGDQTLLTDPSSKSLSVPLHTYMQQHTAGFKANGTEAKPSLTLQQLLIKYVPAIVFIIIAAIGFLVLKSKDRLQFTDAYRFATVTFNADTAIAQGALPVESLSLLIDGKAYEAERLQTASFRVDNVPVPDSAANAIVQVGLQTGMLTSAIDLSHTEYTFNVQPGAVADSLPNQPADVALPAALNEIWSIRDLYPTVAFYLQPKLFFYAEKGRTPTGQMQVVEANQMDSGTFRIINKMASSNRFEVFFVRNVGDQSLQWARCRSNTFNTIEEARQSNYSGCASFTNGQVSYASVSPSANAESYTIQLPQNSVNLHPSQERIMQIAANRFNALTPQQQKQVNASISLNGFYKYDRDVQQRQAAIRNSRMGRLFRNANWQYKPFSGNAFQRDYVKIEFGAPKDDTRPDCNRIFYSLREANSVNPAVVCKLDLSNQKLTSIPKEVFSFVNLQQLNLSGNAINAADLRSLRSRMPKLEIINNANNGYENNPVQQQEPLKAAPTSSTNPALNDVVKAALSQVNMSQASNDDPVAKYLRAVGQPSASTWNAAFVYWCYSSAGYTPLRKTASARQMWSSLSASNKLSAAAARRNPSLIQPGNIFFMTDRTAAAKGGVGGYFDYGEPEDEYRVGIVISISDGVVETVEANTAVNATRQLYPNRVVHMQRKLAEIDIGFSNFSAAAAAY